jgi:outer membrane biosynthesis protein TonB
MMGPMGGQTNKGIFGWVAVFAAGFVIGYGLMSMAVEVPAPQPAPQEQAQPAPATPVAEPQNAALTAPAVEPAAPASAAPIQAPETAQAAAPEPAPAAIPEPTPEPVVEAPKPTTWWDKCRGKTCQVDFGVLTGGLSIRRASVTHGTTIDWDQDFGSTERIGVLKVSNKKLVDVKGVALDAKGQPAAAEISFTEAGAKVSGVISLRPGDKTIRFIPSEN